MGGRAGVWRGVVNVPAGYGDPHAARETRRTTWLKVVVGKAANPASPLLVRVLCSGFRLTYDPADDRVRMINLVPGRQRGCVGLLRLISVLVHQQVHHPPEA